MEIANLNQASAAQFDKMKKTKKYTNLGIWTEFDMYFKNFKKIIT